MAIQIEMNEREAMGATYIPRSNSFPLGFGSDLISNCKDKMGIKTTMLAALLGVTERTLSTWSEVSLAETQASGKILRLVTLNRVVEDAVRSEIKGKVILNLLNEPIPNDRDERTLLDYIVDDPGNPLLEVVIPMLIESFKK
jgi:DNA-binding transcriptional regulator YiaG